MVLVSVLRQTAAKRIPLIKFRRQREEEAAAARTGTLSNDGLKKSASPASVCLFIYTYDKHTVKILIDKFTSINRFE